MTGFGPFDAVVLASGDYPRRGTEARRVLDSALRVIACDGAADAYRRRSGREADFTVGDMDSVRRLPAKGAVAVREQQTNDLAKAIRFCRARGWRKLAAVGATGKREDHAIGNVYRAMEAGVTVVTDSGVFLPFVRGRGAWRLRLGLEKGAPVSVFALDVRAKMRSEGLEWPLEGVVFARPYAATLNRALGAVSVVSDAPGFAYVPE